jgi:hypothetical protein
MKQYYQAWKFRHPEPNDFVRIMEKVSGLQLKWYLNYWINTTKQIDYGIKSFIDSQGSTFITLERIGEIPMPIDLVITYTDGSQELYYIPTNETLGNKPVEDTATHRLDLEAWPWVYPTYTLKIDRHPAEIKRVQIDPSKRMADVDSSNNSLDLTSAIRAFEHPTR